MRKVLTSVALLTVIGASTAKADFKDFLYRCSPGSLRACASIQVFTTLNGSGGTDVRIRVRNLAGQLNPGWADNTGGSVLTRVGIVAPPTGSFTTGLTTTLVGGASSNGPAASKWLLRTPGGLGNLIELTAGLQTSATLSGGIVGCAVPASGYQGTRFTTCGSGAFIEFSFSTSNAWSAFNSEVAWLTRDIAAYAGPLADSTIECGTDFTGTPGNPREWCTQVTPEPVTMLLLGSGLAGMGGFGIMRRRKGLDVENN